MVQRMRTILIVEDDSTTRAMIEAALRESGYVTTCADSVSSALKSLGCLRPDMVILDLGLPDGCGLEVCRRMRAGAALRRIPVIALTGHGSFQEKTKGFDAGVDQYLTKPIPMAELLLCVKALFRRIEIDNRARSFRAPAVSFDEKARLIIFGHEVVGTLTRREFDLFAALIRNSPRILGRTEILESVWDARGTGNLVNAHIFNLRRKLPKALAAGIECVTGLGFRYLGDKRTDPG